MSQNYFAVSFPLWILDGTNMYGFLLTYLDYIHGRDFNVLLENEEGIFHSLINNFHCCEQAGQRFLFGGDWPLPTINTTFLTFRLSLQTPSVCRLHSFLFVFLRGREIVCVWYEAGVGGISLILNVFWKYKLKITSVMKMFFPCCWCIMLNKPFGVFTVETA